MTRRERKRLRAWARERMTYDPKDPHPVGVERTMTRFMYETRDRATGQWRAGMSTSANSEHGRIIAETIQHAEKRIADHRRSRLPHPERFDAIRVVVRQDFFARRDPSAPECKNGDLYFATRPSKTHKTFFEWNEAQDSEPTTDLIQAHLLQAAEDRAREAEYKLSQVYALKQEIESLKKKLQNAEEALAEMRAQPVVLRGGTKDRFALIELE